MAVLDKGKIAAYLDDNPYAYMTVYDGNRIICEGTVRSLSLILDFRRVSFASFFAMDMVDGGIEIEASVSA